MADTTKLTRKDVKKELKRINKLPEYERDRQMKALNKRVSDEIQSTCARIDNDQHSMKEKQREGRRLLYCVMVLPKDYRKSIYEIWDRAFSEVYGIALKPDYIRKEVKRIKELPKHEYEREMRILIKEIEKYIDDGESKKSLGGNSNLIRSIEALPKEYEKVLKAKYWSVFDTSMVHVSGLPLPQRAQVQVSWEGNELSILSGVKEFSLPMDRIINMGLSLDKGGVGVGTIGGVGAIGTTVGDSKAYLTVEYDKEGETKHIVVFSTQIKATTNIVNYFYGVKKIEGAEIIKQEL